MLRVIFVLFVFLASLPSQAMAFDHGYALWNRDLAQFNEGGYIHYGAWQRNRTRLNRFLTEMRQVTVQQMRDWEPAQRKAFWINAHNALVVANILKVYPKLSWLKDGSYMVAGQEVTATDIRDKVLRGSETKIPMLSDMLLQDTTIAEGRDWRVLFALCEGVSTSPPLGGAAYTAKHLSEQLDAQVSRTVVNSAYVRIDPRLRIFHVGGFFRTYREDFKKYQGSTLLFVKSDSRNRGLLRFIFPYLDKAMQDQVMAKQKLPWRVDYGLPSHDLNGGD